MTSSTKSLIGLLINQCDREIKNLKMEKRGVRETVEADLDRICLDNGIINTELTKDIKERYRQSLVTLKTESYDQAINKLILVKIELSSVY
jgi:hypothetical protein